MKPPTSTNATARASQVMARVGPRRSSRPSGRIAPSPSSLARRNIENAPSNSATSVMSVMPCRAIRKKNGQVPIVSSDSHAARRLTSRASISHISVRPMTASSTNGRRIARRTLGPEVISPE